MKKAIALIFALTLCLAAAAVPRVSLLTALPGSEIYELEGHTALRVHDSENGFDAVVNWGVFDFQEPNFVGRFVAGKTDYLCAAAPTDLFLQSYAMQGRQVVEQPLRLDSAQTARLIELVDENLLPENRVYRYNYVLDNCATRPLNLIEKATGRTLIPDSASTTTFRREMQRFHKDYPWYQFGIDLALGRGIDRPVSVRQTAFAPVTLMNLLEQSDIADPPVSIGEQTLRHSSTPWYLTPLAAALLVLALSIAVSFSPVAGKVFDSLMFGSYFLLGCVLTFLVFFSSHEATSPNLLLLWLNPLCLLGAILPWLKSAKKLKISYFFANFALLIMLTALAPALGRAMNAAFWPLIAADALRSVCNIMSCKRTIHS